eukprot:g89.t1
MASTSLSKILVEVEGCAGAPGPESKEGRAPADDTAVSVKIATVVLDPTRDTARRFAAQELDRIMDSDVRNWPEDRLHAFIGDDRYGLPDAAKAAMRSGISSGRQLLTGELASTPEKVLRNLASLLGAKSLGAEAWEEALGDSGAAELGNCAELRPDDVKDAFIDEDIVELEGDPEAWLAELKTWEIKGLDAESALKIKAKILEIEAAALSRAKELLPAVERLVSDAKATQMMFDDGHNSAQRACDLLPGLWPLLVRGKLQEGIHEIEKVIEIAAAADEVKKKAAAPAAHGGSYEVDVLKDMKLGGKTTLYAMNGELQDQARQEEEHADGKQEDGESKADKAQPPVSISAPVDKILSKIVTEHTTTSFEAAPAPATAVRDWGEDYRQLTEMPEEDGAKAKYELISEISQNFINDVAIVGKRIIEEIFIKEYRRLSFKPSSGMGGIAGGRKYVVNGIFYKLASAAEEGSPYEGSFEAANKGAGHDLRGATAISNAAEAIKKDKPEQAMPHVTLSALVDYLGFRLQAMPTLPLEKGSLQLGSDDAGDSVKNESDELALMFADLAGKLGMAPHRILQSADKAEKEECDKRLKKLEEKDEKSAKDADKIKDLKAKFAAFDDKEVTMPFGLDVEGHFDRKGRPVALDFARVFSPEHIGVTKHLSMKTPGTIFVRHLRPELIKEFAKSDDGAPLSADALSFFSSEASDGPEMNERVKNATLFLLDEVVPAAAKELDEAQPEDIKRGGEISPFLHERGINVRHMGLVYHHCTNNEVRVGLLAEMVARTIKNIMRHAAREAVQRLGCADIAGVRKLYTALLNLVFRLMGTPITDGAGDLEQQRFWQADIWDGLRRRFGDRSDAVKGRLRELVPPNLGAVKQMIWRLADMLGLVFSDDCREALQSDPGLDEKPDQGFFFTSTDIKALEVRVKYMTVVDRAAGKVLEIEQEAGAKDGAQDTAVSARLAKAAQQRFNAVLRSTPGDAEATKSINDLGKLTRVKDVMDRLIGFNERTRTSKALIEMRDELEVGETDGDGRTWIDLRDAPAGGSDDIIQWWADLIDLVVDDGKFNSVSHFRVGENEGRGIKWEGHFDYKKDRGLFPVSLLRGNVEESIEIEELRVGNASGLVYALARRWETNHAGVVIKKVAKFRDMDRSDIGWMINKGLGKALAATKEIDLSKSKFESDLSKVQWPAGLQILNLQECEGVEAVKWPEGLQTLSLGSTTVSGDLAKVQWPAELQRLDLGLTAVSGDFSAVKWPEGLEELSLGSTMVSGDLSKIQWPAALRKLSLQYCYNIEDSDGDLLYTSKEACDKLRSWIAEDHAAGGVSSSGEKAEKQTLNVADKQATDTAEPEGESKQDEGSRAKKTGFFGKLFSKKRS